MSGAARPRPPATDTYAALVRGMNALGYTEGTNLAIEWRFASGALDQLPGFAKELVAANVDVIVTPGTQAAQAAQQATRTIPIVLAIISDPVATGIVKSLARPGDNITGLSNVNSEKHLEMLMQTVPKLDRAAVLMNAGNPGNQVTLKRLQLTGETVGVAIVPVAVRNAAELENGLEQMPRELLIRADEVIE